METGEEEVVGWDFVVRLRPAQEAPRGSRTGPQSLPAHRRRPGPEVGGWVGWLLALGLAGVTAWVVTRLWSVATREERRSKSLRSGPMERDSQVSASVELVRGPRS